MHVQTQRCNCMNICTYNCGHKHITPRDCLALREKSYRSKRKPKFCWKSLFCFSSNKPQTRSPPKCPRYKGQQQVIEICPNCKAQRKQRAWKETQYFISQRRALAHSVETTKRDISPFRERHMDRTASTNPDKFVCNSYPSDRNGHANGGHCCLNATDKSAYLRCKGERAMKEKIKCAVERRSFIQTRNLPPCTQTKSDNKPTQTEKQLPLIPLTNLAPKDIHPLVRNMSSIDRAKLDAKSAARKYGWDKTNPSDELDPKLVRGVGVLHGTTPDSLGRSYATQQVYYEPGIEWKRWEGHPRTNHGRYPVASTSAPNDPLPVTPLRPARSARGNHTIIRKACPPDVRHQLHVQVVESVPERTQPVLRRKPKLTPSREHPVRASPSVTKPSRAHEPSRLMGSMLQNIDNAIGEWEKPDPRAALPSQRSSRPVFRDPMW